MTFPVFKAALLSALAAIVWFGALMVALPVSIVFWSHVPMTIIMIVVMVVGLFLFTESDYMQDLSSLAKAAIFIGAYAIVFFPAYFGMFQMPMF